MYVEIHTHTTTCTCNSPPYQFECTIFVYAYKMQFWAICAMYRHVSFLLFIILLAQYQTERHWASKGIEEIKRKMVDQRIFGNGKNPSVWESKEFFQRTNNVRMTKLLAPNHTTEIIFENNQIKIHLWRAFRNVVLMYKPPSWMKIEFEWICYRKIACPWKTHGNWLSP